MVENLLRQQQMMGSSGDASEQARLHVDSQGSGPVLVLSHGLGGSARNFMPQVRALRSSHKIWLYDTRGHARSEAPAARGAYGWPALVADFDRIAAAAMVDPTNSVKRPFVVGGLSLGAATALLWALQTPTRTTVPTMVDGLVLAAYPDSSAPQRGWAQQFAQAIDADGLERAGDRYVWGPGAAFASADAGMIRRGFLEHSPQALAGILSLALAKIPDIGSIAPALRKITIPTLVIVGGDDERSLDASRTLASSMPNSRLAIIEGAGHVVNLSQPGAFNRELTRFIDDLPADEASAP
jgi:pimeloyl-ACP methyl ester carboxylesterase